MKSSPRQAGECICDVEKTRILEGKKDRKKVIPGRKRRGSGSKNGGCIKREEKKRVKRKAKG